MDGSTVVLVAVLVVWLGILAYLITLDRKVGRLERKVKKDEA
jgi:CcmD family protein